MPDACRWKVRWPAWKHLNPSHPGTSTPSGTALQRLRAVHLQGHRGPAQGRRRRVLRGRGELRGANMMNRLSVDAAYRSPPITPTRTPQPRGSPTLLILTLTHLPHAHPSPWPSPSIIPLPLGLSLCTLQGHGSTFYVELPMRRAPKMRGTRPLLARLDKRPIPDVQARQSPRPSPPRPHCICRRDGGLCQRCVCPAWKCSSPPASAHIQAPQPPPPFAHHAGASAQPGRPSSRRIQACQPRHPYIDLSPRPPAAHGQDGVDALRAGTRRQVSTYPGLYLSPICARPPSKPLPSPLAHPLSGPYIVPK